MVASKNNDLYTPFPGPFSVEDSAQSSEEGSGLHSPTFLNKESVLDGHRGDFRLPAPDLDIHSVEGLLASHFSVPSHIVPAFSAPSYHHPVSEVDHHYSYIPHQHDYEDERERYFPRPPRAYFGLHPSPQSPGPYAHEFTDARPPMILPALPAGISDRRVYLSTAGEPAHASEVSVGDEYDSTSPISPREGRSSRVSNARSTRSDSPNRSSGPRREASLVVIACRQCRLRKIRCDSTRPACNNCVRRSNECQYDAVPKRRGPDKRPGTRQRSCKKRPTDGSLPQKKKQKIADDGELAGSSTKEGLGLRLDMTFTGRSTDAPQSGLYTDTPVDDLGQRPFQFPSGSTSPSTTMSLHAPVPRVARSPTTQLALSKVSAQRGGPFSVYDDLNANALSPATEHKPFMRPYDLNGQRPQDRIYIDTPAVERKVWWDNLLNDYSPTREQSQRDITSDLSFLFSTSNYWLSFINEKLFFRALWDDAERDVMQPSLVFAGLALATLMKSSELGHGQVGRDRALWLRDAAQASLEASWNAAEVDPTLAEAAMILALFESSAHPAHTADRACNALLFLDQIIRALSLTQIDADDPAASVFLPDTAPVIPRTHANDITTEKRCFCVPLAHSPPFAREHMSAPWASTPGWDVNWTVSEIRREETRRLCWSALALAAAHTAHCAAFNREPLELFLIQPENYALLFPGEKLHLSKESGSIQSPKQTVWALYCRSMLLWNGCLRLRKGTASDGDKAEFALQAWMETQEIQDTIDSHICAVDTHLLYMTREYLFNTRVAITYEFRRLQNLDSVSSPMFNRQQAEEWLYYQNQTAKRFQVDLYDSRDPQAHVLARRPFYVWWFMSQVAISMSLWAYDRTLTQALELCKAFLVPLDILSALWPCQAQRDRYIELREELAQNCAKAGLQPPPPADFNVPLALRM